ncbi:putative Anti-anti-sigma regulatory factor [Magnetospirillum sp. LM-5]|uniref:STAS domain-containing protein n=1 Tax=Magnetospirillum sp. LM-5 TaxID=2681466 RepID=UPI00137F102A|nr:STAS domain-containing protein [Magnetospirillum sp. LM-5]CAA7619165.1 putative Anti-anti-sigma regulatory factor [Magnetospirillum sp. LM-5]
MEYVVENEQGDNSGIVICLTGRVDYAAVGSFTSIIETAQELAPKRLRVDMTRVSGIDSVGFGLMIMLREALPTAQIVLSGAEGVAKRLLGLFDASSLFEIRE